MGNKAAGRAFEREFAQDKAERNRTATKLQSSRRQNA